MVYRRSPELARCSGFHCRCSVTGCRLGVLNRAIARFDPKQPGIPVTQLPDRSWFVDDMPQLDPRLYDVVCTLRIQLVHRFPDKSGALFEMSAQRLNSIVEVRVHRDLPAKSGQFSVLKHPGTAPDPGKADQTGDGRLPHDHQISPAMPRCASSWYEFDAGASGISANKEIIDRCNMLQRIAREEQVVLTSLHWKSDVSLLLALLTVKDCQRFETSTCGTEGPNEGYDIRTGCCKADLPDVLARRAADPVCELANAACSRMSGHRDSSRESRHLDQNGVGENRQSSEGHPKRTATATK
ncbi:hypothetical protein BH160DRAFT_0815 [Burkholderia sp. H160]|nr:hypothetical protein BH160DRAFT_0815 [Burkholderia sp. H160]